MTAENDIISRCPQCATAFRVTAEVLHVANGAVRCGSCLRVFNAKNYLLSDGKLEKTAIHQVPPTHKEPSVHEKPLAHKEPSAHKQPPADKETSANKEQKPIEHHRNDALLTDPNTPEEKQSVIKNEALPTNSPHTFDKAPFAHEQFSVNIASTQLNDPSGKTPKNNSSLFPRESSANDEHDESWALELLHETEQTEAILADEELDEELIFAEKSDDFAYEPVIDEPKKEVSDLSEKPTSPSPADTTDSRLEQHDSPDSLITNIITNDLLDETTIDESSDQLLGTDDEYSTLIPNSETSTENTTSPTQSINEELNDDSWADDLLVDENSAPDAILVPSTVLTTTTPSDAPSQQEQATSPTKTVSDKTTSDNPQSDVPPVNLDFEKDSIHFHEETPTRRQWPWVVGSLFLLIALGGQTAWSQLDQWSSLPNYRAYYESACKIIDCQLPAQTNIHQIRSTHLVVRSHPDQAGALIVDAIIANDAEFSQPFPGIRLVFLNIEEQLVASRVFKPSEYVKGELFGETNMPAQQSIQLSLAIADPGEQAVNYRLEIVPTPP